MRFAIIGNGGREHSLAWKLHQEGHEVFGHPENTGIARIGENIPKDATLVAELRKRNIEMVLIGPEDNIIAGQGDAIHETTGIPVVACSQAAAALEGSKIFAQTIMDVYGIPTARGVPVLTPETAEFIINMAYRDGKDLVIKADGTCGGKGVLLPTSREEALGMAREMLEGKSVAGKAGRKMLLVERLEGPEVSIMVVVDEHGDYVILPPSGDHKRREEGDKGKNTGGMGAYAPSPYVDARMLGVIEDTIIQPTIRGMKDNGTLFKGLLYCGLMLTAQGPKVLEYNIRFGDPETQAQLALVENLGEVLIAYSKNDLKNVQLRTKPGHACCTVIATKGYPAGKVMEEEGQKGHPITGIEEAEAARAIVFHAGTDLDKDKRIINTGGRVLGVTYVADSLEEAARKASECSGFIRFGDTEFAAFRRDIGKTAIAYIAAQERR